MPSKDSKPFPPARGMTSFWRSNPGSLDNHRSTESLPSECDILIIGAGYSGASLLTHLLANEKYKDKSIVVLEARQLCSGASGRNGGHIKPDVYNLCSALSSKHGVQAAVEIAEFEKANLLAVREYIAETGADCDFTLTQAVDVQLSGAQDSSLKSRYDQFVREGGSVAKDAFYMHGEDAEMVSGVKGAQGVFEYTAAHVWPYKLIHHMFEASLVHDNVNVQTHTPVTSIPNQPDADGRWVISTTRGTNTAKQVVMATNAYTAALLPEYDDKIIPYRGVCSRIVTPGPDRPPLLANTYALRFNDWDYDYLIPRNDGSIVVGGARRTYLRHLEDWYGNVDDTQMVKRAEGYFDGYMQRHFRGWEDSGAYTDSVWTGIMGYSADHLPRIGCVPGRKNMFIMGGFTGHGMPQIFLAAKGLSKVTLNGTPFSETGVPRLFEETAARLESPENFVLDVYASLGTPSKL
ncbi:FAD dependent oxidoreductase [Emericellopsis atlantica]|uniref:FAD dependent oxidoreductase n=1 Tax=Emericellopsis atlantica TaxID=2614577 RepID=A0A9P7ZDJ9_9HYPO|nr:FAD dependent oxidoreductase [Emericellopsis atlantica]KAG9250104.1 FAD dependent oxidoreductase [Emericellopsis atlantica]